MLALLAAVVVEAANPNRLLPVVVVVLQEFHALDHTDSSGGRCRRWRAAEEGRDGMVGIVRTVRYSFLSHTHSLSLYQQAPLTSRVDSTLLYSLESSSRVVWNPQ